MTKKQILKDFLNGKPIRLFGKPDAKYTIIVDRLIVGVIGILLGILHQGFLLYTLFFFMIGFGMIGFSIEQKILESA